MTITSEQARAMIPYYTQLDICIELRRRGMDSGQLAEKTMWLVYLCSKGDIYSVKDFIQSTEPTELRAILNKKLYENWDGTVLHAVLYWNTGNNAVDLFELLVEHGADPVQDYYGFFPWENIAPLWICPFGGQIGERNVDEFEETYQYLREIYGDQPKLNQNASPIAAPVLDEDIENVAYQLLNTHVARRLNFDIDDEIAAENDDVDYSDMPALISDMPPLEYVGAPRTVPSMKSPLYELLLKYGLDYSDIPALVGSNDYDVDYSDMPALVDSDDEDEYADMPALVRDSDDEDEYADMPALVSVPETRLVYSDDEEFYD
jgi:hypothetical protein